MQSSKLLLYLVSTAIVNIGLGWLLALLYHRRVAQTFKGSGGFEEPNESRLPDAACLVEELDRAVRQWAAWGQVPVRFQSLGEQLRWSLLVAILGGQRRLLELDRQLHLAEGQADAKRPLGEALQAAFQLAAMLHEAGGLARRIALLEPQAQLDQAGESWSDLARHLTELIAQFTRRSEQMPWARTEETRDCLVNVSELIHGLRDELHEQLARMGDQVKRWRELPDSLLRDSWSGLWNRLGLECQVNAFWESVSPDCPVSAVLVDVDRFRRVQQQRGVYLGERLVDAVAQLAMDQLRSERGFDRMGRLGGATFLAMLGGTPLSDAVRVAERLRQTVEASSFAVGGMFYELTVSCAVLGWQRGEPLSQVLGQLRAALEEARRSGRNRTCVSEANQLRVEAGEPQHVTGRLVQVSLESNSADLLGEGIGSMLEDPQPSPEASRMDDSTSIGRY